MIFKYCKIFIPIKLCNISFCIYITGISFLTIYGFLWPYSLGCMYEDVMVQNGETFMDPSDMCRDCLCLVSLIWNYYCCRSNALKCEYDFKHSFDNWKSLCNLCEQIIYYAPRLSPYMPISQYFKFQMHNPINHFTFISSLSCAAKSSYVSLSRNWKKSRKFREML